MKYIAIFMLLLLPLHVAQSQERTVVQDFDDSQLLLQFDHLKNMVEASLNNLQNEINNLKAEINALKADISSMKSKITQLENNLAALEARVRVLENALAALNDRVGNLEISHQNMANQILDILARLDRLEARTTSAEINYGRCSTISWARNNSLKSCPSNYVMVGASSRESDSGEWNSMKCCALR